MSEQEQIYHSAAFKRYVNRKGRFVIILTIFFCIYYFSLPFLTSLFPKVKSLKLSGVPFIWAFALSQIIMTWFICHLYSSKAKGFDEEAQNIINNYEE